MDTDFNSANIKTVGIVGLGLIGGSYAKAYHTYADCRVLGCNRTHAVTEKALAEGVLDGELTEDTLPDCDLVIVTLYPGAIIDYVTENAAHFKKDALVIDAGGLKRNICAGLFPVAKKNGFFFIGGHPMAGKHVSGYDYSTGELFRNASMILVPDTDTDPALLKRAEAALAPCQFGKFTVCTPERHDAMIAFTSELAHIVSNAYVKSPTARQHDGFSAGSYRDLTRVAFLNETMWTEIFMENRDCLIFELNSIIHSLEEYRDAMEKKDSEALWQLLHEGKLAKEEIDGFYTN
ncbi:MAG: prephenate dehydrogenase [Eubacterium sp.]|nr:prephenate dehydrogenase [Eubacterium sp.]